MTECPLCSGYGTILLHDRESDEERETPCHKCAGSGELFEFRVGLPHMTDCFCSYCNAMKPPKDLEKELDAVVKRVAVTFGDKPPSKSEP